MAIVNTEEVSDDLISSILNVEDGSVRILHTDSPSLHFRDGIEYRVIAARRGGLFRDGLRECLTHVVELI